MKKEVKVFFVILVIIFCGLMLYHDYKKCVDYRLNKGDHIEKAKALCSE